MKSNKTDNNNKVCFINGRGDKMAGLKKLPIGIENFEEIRQEDFYYVDKTRVIEQLLTEWGKQKNNQHTGHFCAKADKIKVWNCLL